MDELELMDWFESCGHEIAVIHNNKNGYTGIAICKETQDTFKVSGDDKLKILSNLRDMLNGTYR